MWKMSLDLSSYDKPTLRIFLLQTGRRCVCCVGKISSLIDHHSGITIAISTVICVLHPSAEALSC